MKPQQHLKNRTARSVVFLVLLLVIGYRPQEIRAQSKAEIEQTVRGMSQDEIDRRLKELGMTREEAIQRAKENGINVEEHLLCLSRKAETPLAAMRTFVSEEPLRIIATPKEAPLEKKKTWFSFKPNTAKCC